MTRLKMHQTLLPKSAKEQIANTETKTIRNDGMLIKSWKETMVQTKKMFTLCSGEKMIILISSRVAVFFHKLNLTFEEF